MRPQKVHSHFANGGRRSTVSSAAHPEPTHPGIKCSEFAEITGVGHLAGCNNQAEMKPCQAESEEDGDRSVSYRYKGDD